MKLRFHPGGARGAIPHIAVRSPRGTLSVAARIRAVTTPLVQQPRLRRRTSDGRLRRITATPYPYHVFHEVTAAEVIGIAVGQAARDPAAMTGWA